VVVVDDLWNDSTLGDRYPWLLAEASAQIDLSIFDTRSQTALRRANIRTWGDLARRTDASISSIPNVGALTVRRINDAVAAHALAMTHGMRSTGADETTGRTLATGKGPNSEALLFRLRCSSVWVRAVIGGDTVGDLISAYSAGVNLPNAVRAEVEELLGTRLPDAPLSSASLPDLVDQIVQEATDPDLLVARECAREQPTLEALGKLRGVTRERVRQKVAKDVAKVREALGSARYQGLQWAVQRLRDDLGLVAPANSKAVAEWSDRIGEDRFQVLRWLGGYDYRDDWLIRGSEALPALTAALDKAIDGAWLVRAQDVRDELEPAVDGDTALEFLLASGAWRDIGDGWLVRWDGPIQAKAERVLRLACRPMTPAELVEAIGSGSEGSIKNQRGSRLVRIDKRFRLALSDWGFEEYEGITREIDQRIERGDGRASVAAIIEEFVRDFGVSESSVRTYLESGPYVLSGDEVRHLEDRAYTPASVLGRRHAVRVGESWGQRFTVAGTNLNGYSFGLDRDIAAHNGIQPDDSLVVPAIHNDHKVGEASIIWRLTNLNGTVDVGRLSSVLKAMGVEEGDEVVVVPTPQACTVFRPDELPTAPPRSSLSGDVKRSILGRH
jgi:hypothetical protein